MLSDILAGKILPLMQCDKMPEENRKEIENTIKQECGRGADYVTEKFKRMADDDDSISFWWR